MDAFKNGEIIQMEMKTVNINGKEFNYIVKNGKSIVDGIVVKVNDKLRESINRRNRFISKEIIEGLQDEKVETMTVLSLTGNMMTNKVIVYLKTKRDYLVFFRKNIDLVRNFKDIMNKGEVPYQEINSLEHIKENECLNGFLNDYYSPKSLDDTGIYIDGEMIKPGDKLIVNNMQETIKDDNRFKDTNALGVDKAEVKLYKNRPYHNYGFIGEGISFDINNNTVKDADLKRYIISKYKESNRYEYDRLMEENKERIKDSEGNNVPACFTMSSDMLEFYMNAGLVTKA